MHLRMPATLLVLGSAIVSGCGAQSTPTASTARAQPIAMPFEGPRDLCPMAVEGTVVEAGDIEGGAGLVFTTVRDVAELRRRVRLVARLHGERAGSPTLVVSTDDVRDGARLNIRPLDPDRVAAVRQFSRAHAMELDRANCPAQLGSEALVSWLVAEDATPDRVVTSR
jgi:hypothetical protein